MATITDDFSGGAGNLNGATVSGGTYTWMTGEGTGCSDTGGVCVGNDASGWSSVYISNMPDSADVTVQTKHASGTATAVFARVDTTNDTGYAVRVESAGGALVLRRINGGQASNTQLDTWTGTINDGDTIKITTDGTTIKGYHEGTERLSATDSNYSTGSVGLAIFEQNGTLDDFSATIPDVPSSTQGVAGQTAGRITFWRG